MKRVLSFVLVLALAFALAVPAVAAPGNGNGNGKGNNKGSVVEEVPEDIPDEPLIIEEDEDEEEEDSEDGEELSEGESDAQPEELAQVLFADLGDPAADLGNTGNNGGQSDIISDAPSYPLHQGVGPFDWTDYLQGESFGINENKGEHNYIPGYELGTEGTVFWHFINPDKLGGYANITFLDENGDEVVFEGVESYKNNQHFGIVALGSWALLSAEYFPANAPKKGSTQFNLSHTAGTPPDEPPTEFLGVASFTKMKMVDGMAVFSETGEFGFYLYKIEEDGTRTQVGDLYMVEDGVVSATIEEAGSYVFVEAATEGWELANYKGGLFFEMAPLDETSETLIPTWDLEDGAIEDEPTVINRETGGSLKVSVDALKQHEQETTQEFHERDVQEFYTRNVQKFYTRTVQDFYERTVQEYYERTVQEFYERDVQDIYSRDVQEFFTRDVQDFYTRNVQDFYEQIIQKYFVPVFAKTVVEGGDDTRTSYLGDNAGGRFTNGMVWLALNVEQARNEGYTFGIASSGKDNSPIGYDYFVKIKGDQLIVSFDDRFIEAIQATAKVYDAPPTKHDNGGHIPVKTGETLVVDLPAGYGDTVYLYTHFNQGLRWFESHDYHFIEWELKESVIVKDYELIDTEIGEYALIKTVEGEYVLVDTVESAYALVDTVEGEYSLADTVESAYALVDTVEGEYALVRTDIGEYALVDTVEGEYALDKTETGDYQLIDTVVSKGMVTDEYNVEFDLVIKNEADETVYSGKIANGGEVAVDYLEAGSYTCILSSDDFADQTRTVTVVVGEEASAAFDDITVIGPSTKVTLDADYSDNKLADQFSDNKLADQFSDNKLADQFSDNKLEDVKTDNKLADQFSDNKLEDQFSDNKLEDVKTDNKLEDVKSDNKLEDQFSDSELPDIYLGNETDPFDPNAIRRN